MHEAALRFLHVTTFYGAHSFGGDASYVDRLAAALARRGHDVDVVHLADAFDAVRGVVPLRPWKPPLGVRVHTLRTSFGRLAPLWSHQTGLPLPTRDLGRIMAESAADVVHFHNVSLAGAPSILGLARRSRPDAAVLMSAHDYWLVCPMHVLWKLDRRPCERPQCMRCVVASGRPPQLWRHGNRLARAVASLDALVFPSRFAQAAHAERGIRGRSHVLPYFVPSDWPSGTAAKPDSERPYFLAVGRLVKEKGFQDLLQPMRRLPGVDLLVAGAGSYEPELRTLATGLPNVQFVGIAGPERLALLYGGALAALVPSRFPETFGYVIVEALAAGTPVVARRRGALPEVVGDTGGGLVFDSPEELERAMCRLACDERLRAELGGRGRAAVAERFSEQRHLAEYERIIAASPHT